MANEVAKEILAKKTKELVEEMRLFASWLKKEENKWKIFNEEEKMKAKIEAEKEKNEKNRG